MKIFFIQKSDFRNFVTLLSGDFRTFYLKGQDKQFNWKSDQKRRLYWQEYRGDLEGLLIGEVRSQDPLKQFVFSSKERVSEDFKGLEDKKDRPVLLIGAKNCDLSGLEITDYVFMQGDFKDPFYINKRDSMFVIAGDCSNPVDTCFCSALGIKAYPEKNYDLGLSDIGEGYVVEVVSDRVGEYVSKYRAKFNLATDAQLRKKEELRNTTAIDLENNIRKHEVPRKSQLEGAMKKGFDSKIWEDEVQACVECGCCNVICPTCHCFFLGDTTEANKNIRYKIWDACLYKDFAVVAGGANPRKRIFQRLRNRYEKKFDFFPSTLGKIACTGCGRCISGCPGKIDIRRILKNLVSEIKATV